MFGTKSITTDSNGNIGHLNVLDLFVVRIIGKIAQVRHTKKLYTFPINVEGRPLRPLSTINPPQIRDDGAASSGRRLRIIFASRDYKSISFLKLLLIHWDGFCNFSFIFFSFKILLLKVRLNRVTIALALMVLYNKGNKKIIELVIIKCREIFNNTFTYKSIIICFLVLNTMVLNWNFVATIFTDLV